MAQYCLDLQFICQGKRVIVCPFSPHPWTGGEGRLEELDGMLRDKSVPLIEPLEVAAIDFYTSTASRGSIFGPTNSDGSNSDSHFCNANGTVIDSPLNRPLN